MSGSRIRKMKYVKQRFNSTAVPLQRSILFFEAIWSWCIDVIATRPGQEPAKHAARFLSVVTAEDLLQAAMMADASDEHLMLRRFFDTRGWDPMSVGSELDLFLRNLDFLFIKQHAGQPPQEVGCMRSGFVRHACEVLSKPHVCWVNGTQRVVGGPGTVTTPLLEKCLSRMANWVRLTITAVSGEFPRWQLLRTLDVFHLAKHTKSKAAAPAASDTDLQRLATAFGIDDKLLKMEFESCLHIAQKCVHAGRSRGQRERLGHRMQHAPSRLHHPPEGITADTCLANRSMLAWAQHFQHRAELWKDQNWDDCRYPPLF